MKYFHEGAILSCGNCGTEVHELFEVETEDGETIEVCEPCREEIEDGD